MSTAEIQRGRPAALSLLASERPRNVSWTHAAGLLFGDWGTSRLYVLGLAYFFARGTSFYLIAGMSLLVLGVGWAYTQICRIYPDGGGVYTAARHRSQILGVIGALLLFADYVVTASLSALDAFHYFGLGHTTSPLAWDSPGLWAIVSIGVIGVMNLLGPRHTGKYAVFAALATVAATAVIAVVALPQVNWRELPRNIGPIRESPGQLWLHLVAIVLALSGVEAIGNLTGVMKKPVTRTAGRAIWVVAAEVAIFNVLMALCMVDKLKGEPSTEHKEDMIAFLSGAYLGHWAELIVKALAGMLLLSACNTVITDMISVQYLMSRDGELPVFFQKLNRFGVPLIPAVIATLVPGVVLLVTHELENLAALYAIGVVGAVAINISLAVFHPRLRHWWRKLLAASISILLLGIWVTLAATKHQALIFVSVVLVAGLILRQLTRWTASRRPKPSLLRQAIMEQLPADAWLRPKLLLATAGSAAMAESALTRAREMGATLVVCFIREVALSFKVEADTRMTLDTDLAAQGLFVEFLDLGHKYGVPIIPMYDTGTNSAELIAEAAAMNGVHYVLIGSSRRGVLHKLVKGSFQQNLESLLPKEIPVEVIVPNEPAPVTSQSTTA